jgi:hypothetical protein
MFNLKLSVYYPQSYVQHHVTQNLLTLKFQKFESSLHVSANMAIIITCENLFDEETALFSCKYICRSLPYACVLELVCYVLPCCVFCYVLFLMRMCLGVGVLCSSLLCVLLRALFLMRLCVGVGVLCSSLLCVLLCLVPDALVCWSWCVMLFLAVCFVMSCS